MRERCLRGTMSLAPDVSSIRGLWHNVNVIVFGATGMVGAGVLTECLETLWPPPPNALRLPEAMES
jgi:hypothetical protein